MLPSGFFLGECVKSRQIHSFEYNLNYRDIEIAEIEILLLIALREVRRLMAPPTVSDLVFSEQANHNFSKILGDLKRSNLSITNRLHSIQKDAQFVEQVATAYGLPLVANERCGSWYINPDLKAASAYFKSTDGHTGQWKFSTRRLNLHLLELIDRHNGL